MANIDEENCYNAILVCFLLDFYDKISYFRFTNENVQMNSIKGWIDLEINHDEQSAIDYFERAIAEDYPDGYIGKAYCLKMQRNISEMGRNLHELTAKYPKFVPGFIEHADAFLMAHNWEKATEMAQHVITIQDGCVSAHMLQLLYAYLVNGNMELIDTCLRDLRNSVEKSESNNHQIQFKLAKILGGIGEKGSTTAHYAKNLLDNAIQLWRKSEYLAEKVQRLMHYDDFKTAKPLAIEALQIDSQPEPQILLGIVRCFLAENQIEDALAQLEFVRVTHPAISQSSASFLSLLFYYLSAVVDRITGKSFEQIFQNLRNAIDAHFSSLQNVLFGIDYLRLLDPNFIIDIATQLYDFAPLTPTNGANITLGEISRILSIVHDNCPGLVNTGYLLAKAKYLSNDLANAEILLKLCLDKEETIAEAYLLMAQIHIYKNHYEEAGRYLDTGLSFNFKVREHPLYHLIKAKLQKKSNQIEQSVITLRKAVELPAFQDTVINKRDKLDVTDADRITIYLELIDSLQGIGQIDEADVIMEEATSRWSGKAEEQQLMLMDADLKLMRNDIDGALKVLSSVSPTQSNYQIARIKMAQIYLEEKKDKRQFAICYKQIIERNPSPAAYILLGNAYMSIQEPAKAIEVYETALKNNPKNDELAEKIGQAYVQCHLYNRAVNYYEAALKSGHKSRIRQRLAELLVQLGNYERCEKVLRQGLESNSNSYEVATMSNHVSYWVLLSKLHFEKGDWLEAAEDLTRAKDLQKLLISKSPSELSNLAEEKKFAAKICCQLAELHWNRRDGNKAIEFYKEAIALNNTDIKTMTSLATIYLSMNKFDACNTQCQLVLNIDKQNDDATLMAADLLYQSNETEKAIIHFAQLLDRNPNQYHALAVYIELNWRNGNIEQAEKYLKNALSANPRSTVHAGFNYCKGLYEWYIGEPNTALQAFNRARRDLEWGERAIYNMIEICLNPDNEIIGDEMLNHSEQTDKIGENDREMSIKTAERFLKELRYKPDLDYKYRLMEGFIMLASNNRSTVQQALNNFIEMAGENRDVQNVGAILGCAKAYIILKQVPKAKAQLKRVVGYNWTLENADYLEKCWLLLANLYINQGKNEQTLSLLRTVLQYNASSIKALEYFGYLKEREQKWLEAAMNFEKAWSLSKRCNPSIGYKLVQEEVLTVLISGYKLAHNYLKCKKLFDAIDVCHRILAIHPNFPKIKRDIMDKARANIRT